MAEVEDLSTPRQWVDSSPELQGTCSSFQGPCSVGKHISHEASHRGDTAWSHTNLFTRSAEQNHVAHIITCHHCTAACRNINTAVPATRGKDTKSVLPPTGKWRQWSSGSHLVPDKGDCDCNCNLLPDGVGLNIRKGGALSTMLPVMTEYEITS